MFVGGADDDVLDGRDARGDNRMFGNDGDDTLLAGPGYDRLEGGAGGDILAGAEGHDILLGGPGRDRMGGGPGVDSLFGGLNADEIDSRDDTTELVDCGDGLSESGDTAIINPGDTPIGCEHIEQNPYADGTPSG